MIEIKIEESRVRGYVSWFLMDCALRQVYYRVNYGHLTARCLLMAIRQGFGALIIFVILALFATFGGTNPTILICGVTICTFAPAISSFCLQNIISFRQETSPSGHNMTYFQITFDLFRMTEYAHQLCPLTFGGLLSSEVDPVVGLLCHVRRSGE